MKINYIVFVLIVLSVVSKSGFDTVRNATPKTTVVMQGGVITIQNGTALFVEMMAQNNAVEYIDVGWDANQSGAPNSYIRVRPQVEDAAALPTGTNFTGFARGQYHKFMLIHRATGMFFLSNKSGSTAWQLMHVDNSNNSLNVYPSITVPTSGTNRFIERIHVFNLSAPFDTDYGIATNRVASPAVDETTTSEANALIEMTWTAVTGETWELSTRRTDDDNRWIVRCDQAGSTIKLIERNAGVETERSSAAQTWTNGTQYRLVVIQDGNTIRTYVANVAKNTYTSASFNNTATGVKTNKAGSNLVTYPRTLSGAALSELQRWTS